MKLLKDYIFDNILEEHLQSGDITFTHAYSEKGYHSPERGILFGNWNTKTRWNKETQTNDVIDKTMHRISKIASQLGYEIEWSDEWTTCQDCGKAVRTSPDSYSWTPSYSIFNDCSLVCHECIKDNPTDYLESLENNNSKADTIFSDSELSKLGYTEIERDSDYAHGWYGQEDKPKEILEKALQADPQAKFLFRITGQGQFETSFTLYKKD